MKKLIIGALMALATMGTAVAQECTVVPTPDSMALQFTGPGARAALSAITVGPIDCDVIGGVQTCANYQLGSGAPAGVPTLSELTGANVPEPTDPVSTPTPTPPVTGSTIRIEVESDSATNWADRGEYLEWVGGNFFFGPPDAPNLSYQFTVAASGLYGIRYRAGAAQQTPGRGDLHNDAFVRLDGDPAPGEIDVREYTRMLSTGDGVFRVQSAVGGEERGPFRQVLTAGITYNLDVLGRSTGYAIDYFEIFPISVSAAAPLGGDLFALHYDVAPDRDDIHTLVANYMVTDNMPIDVQAVMGTVGVGITDRYDPIGEDLFTSLYPDGVLVQDNYNLAVITIADRWAETLDSGADVLVAEGGQSDFTADVVRELQSMGVSGLNRITVVQHAPGYNEGNTLTSNLNFLRNTVDYVNIPNGNQAGNGSANLASWQLGIIDPAPFVATVLNSRFSGLWSEAFAILDPTCTPQSFRCRVDFSDSAALLFLIGDTTTEDINDFAERYAQ